MFNVVSSAVMMILVLPVSGRMKHRNRELQFRCCFVHSCVSAENCA